MDDDKDIKPSAVPNEQEIDDIEFTVPTKPVLDNYGFVVDGSEDMTFTLCANPEKYAEFEKTMMCFRNWMYYTSHHNKDNLLKYANKAIENKDYVTIWEMIQYFKGFCELVEPLITADMQKITQENKKRMELRARQDAEAKRIKNESNVKVLEKMKANTLCQNNKIHEWDCKRKEAEQQSKTNQEDGTDPEW